MQSCTESLNDGIAVDFEEHVAMNDCSGETSHFEGLDKPRIDLVEEFEVELSAEAATVDFLCVILCKETGLGRAETMRKRVILLEILLKNLILPYLRSKLLSPSSYSTLAMAAQVSAR